MKRQIFIHGQLHKQPEMQSIIKKYGMGGLGICVMIIEVLSEKNYSTKEFDLIAKEIGDVEANVIEDIICNHDMFKIVNNIIECKLAYFINQN